MSSYGYWGRTALALEVAATSCVTKGTAMAECMAHTYVLNFIYLNNELFSIIHGVYVAATLIRLRVITESQLIVLAAFWYIKSHRVV